MFLLGGRTTTVHPRWRGERARKNPLFDRRIGSSPLARGTVPFDLNVDLGGRFIPAGAGNGSIPDWSHAWDAVHPRWRGERFGG